MTRRSLALVLAFALTARAGQRLTRADIGTPVPLPPGSLMVVGFLGAWEAWDNEKRGVRKVALSLRRRGIPGVYAETAGNHSRRVVLAFLREALDANRNGRLEPGEARGAQIILYGQSFGGAAAVKLARELGRLGVPVRLTVQVDSVGRDDGRIPPNVARALNLYQRDPGPIRGRGEIRAEDPVRTRILGNVRFSYLGRDVEMAEYPRAARRLGVSHWKMDNDPVVWKAVEAAILAEIAAWQAASH